MTRTVLTLSLIAAASTAAPARAALVTSNNHLAIIDGTERRAAQALVRVNERNSANWKHRLKIDRRRTNGQRLDDYFSSTSVRSLSLTLDALTGEATFWLDGYQIETTIELEDDERFVGLDLRVISRRNQGSTELFDLVVRGDGSELGTTSLTSSYAQQRVEIDSFYLPVHASVLEVTASARFTYDQGANLRGNGFSILITPLVAEIDASALAATPAPAGAAVLGFAALGARRRRCRG